MKYFSLSALALLLLPLPALRAAESEAETALQSMVANEEKFCQLGQAEGMRAAFLHYLADDALVFAPGPVNAKKEWTKRPENGASFSWKPLFAAMSRSADLGYTTGPAERRKTKEDAKPSGYSEFVTIWKKQPDGEWRVALDLGGDVPGPAKSEEAPPLVASVVNGPETPAKDRAAAERSLREAEKKFAVAAKADSTIALSESADPEIRVEREGVFPALGKGAATLMLSVRRGHLSSERAGGGMSAAGDLAYGYGKYSLVRGEETEHGYYLQIWRTEPDGAWKIALDFQSPQPAK